MPEPSVMTCPSCRAPLRADAAAVASGYVSCTECGVLVALAGSGGAGAPVAVGPRPAVPLPPRLRLDGTSAGIVITRRWLTPGTFLLIPFCLFWDGFLVVWYSLALGGGAPVPFLLFPLIHVAIGVGLTYTLATRLVNRTRIAAENLALTVEHGPLPWPGRANVAFSDVEQVYCLERRHRKNDDSTTYEVWAVLRDGSTRCLVGGVDLDRQQALYIEQQLETVLEITDRPVPGELPR